VAEPEDYLYSLRFDVRDYECDMEGIVNNAVYQNYLEHARHKFFLSQGIDFAEITRRGIHPVVVRAEIDYKLSLRSGDLFWVGLNVERMSTLRFAFIQDIYREPDNATVVSARIIAATMNASGRPVRPEEMHPAIGSLLVPNS